LMRVALSCGPPRVVLESSFPVIIEEIDLARDSGVVD